MKAGAVVALVAGFFFIPVPASAAEEVSASELIEMSSEFAGSEVAVVGELVGDYGFRNDGWMWTQLNDDQYVDQPLLEGGTPVSGNVGIGVRMPAEMARGLDEPGGYRLRGPVVRATGIWKYHDPERPGESYLDVQSLEVVEPGRQLRNEKSNWTAAGFGILFLAAAGILWWRSRPEA